ncbi:hypothetical protein V6R85_24035 [Agrobacterium sp. CCNWLW32]|uniref:hypothetical protein n=1 Tax=Agrobacterium sp. CCNWLW32 TaxID=3122072 RepID=UPI00300FD1D8
MPSDVDILTTRSFSKLTVDQRDMVLREVSKRLHYVALLARTLSDDRSEDFEQLGSKIDEEREELAADYSDEPAKVVYRALELMDDFDREMTSETRH